MSSTEQTTAALPSAQASRTPGARPSARLLLVRRFVKNRIAVAGLIIVSAVVAIAIIGPFMAPHDPNVQFSGQRLAPPSSEYLLGTDNLGRDLLSRLLHGARPSVGFATAATAIILSVGVLVGAWAGYLGGAIDEFAMRVVDVLLAFPGLILALAIVGVLGPGLVNVIIGVATIAWAEYARVVRGVVLSERERGYVQAAVALGADHKTVVFGHLIPSVLAPVIVLATLQMGGLILTIAGLSFLGLGAQPPSSEWGSMLNQGRQFFQQEPQLMIFPGLMISVTVLGFNLLGDGLRDVLDPRGPR